jgi:hypothetical protein
LIFILDLLGKNRRQCSKVILLKELRLTLALRVCTVALAPSRNALPVAAQVFLALFSRMFTNL